MLRTVLNSIHRDLGAKTAPFAGWEMPIQYSTGILAEHRAVRTAAGLFDVTHMSAFEVQGPHAPAFMDGLTANCVSRIEPGDAQYSCILTPEGTLIDDLFVYRLERERFMIVSNAANAERVMDWMRAVNSRAALIDLVMPAKMPAGPVEIRDLRDAGEESRVGLALQGPVSLSLLRALTNSSADSDVLQRLAPNTFAEVTLAGRVALVARTGYTGEKVGFEIYVHPDAAKTLWSALLDEGKPLGALPAGLGARDSTRAEAGFPLFGHELEGKLGISITEAGYGFVVRSHARFFIGRAAYLDRAARSRRHVLRLQGHGRKTLRPGHVILDDCGNAAAEVTSFAYTHEDKTFIVLACAEEGFRPEPGRTIRGARIPREKFTGDVEERHLVELTVLTRFAKDEERDAWPERYA